MSHTVCHIPRDVCFSRSSFHFSYVYMCVLMHEVLSNDYLYWVEWIYVLVIIGFDVWDFGSGTDKFEMSKSSFIFLTLFHRVTFIFNVLLLHLLISLMYLWLQIYSNFYLTKTQLLFCQDSPSLSVFHQAILSPMTKPIPVITAAISLMSYFRNAVCSIFLINHCSWFIGFSLESW